jgi:hypothetical protein
VTTTEAHARFLVVREQPMLVVDLRGDEPELPMVEDNLFKRVVEAGLLVLPGFYGVQLPKGARVGWTLTGDELRLEDEQENHLLRIPRDAVDPVWEAASLRLRGTMFCLGWHLGVDPADTDKVTCDRLDQHARIGRVAGAVVGVAEPRTGLPLMFG